MSNEDKSALLGLNVSTAAARLRKMIMWGLVKETGKDVCFRCDKRIDDIDDLSIEHKEPWAVADDPKAAFFDLTNIAFSHLRCNIGTANREKEQCPQGHPYDEENTYYRPRGGRGGRECLQCRRSRERDARQNGSRKRKQRLYRNTDEYRERNRKYMRERRASRRSSTSRAL